MGIQPLTQGGARRNIFQTQDAFEEGVVAEILDGIKVVLAQTQQAPVALEIVADKGKAGLGAEVVGQFFDKKIGHGEFHLWGACHFKIKSLIYNGN